jgi:hypothetical protein
MDGYWSISGSIGEKKNPSLLGILTPTVITTADGYEKKNPSLLGILTPTVITTADGYYLPEASYLWHMK